MVVDSMNIDVYFKKIYYFIKERRKRRNRKMRT